MGWKEFDDLEAYAEQLNGAKCGLNGLKEMLNRGVGAREIALCVTKVEEAELWLGRARELMQGVEE